MKNLDNHDLKQIMKQNSFAKNDYQRGYKDYVGGKIFIAYDRYWAAWAALNDNYNRGDA